MIQTLFTALGSDPLGKASTSKTGIKRTYAKEIKSFCITLKGSPTTTLALPKKQHLSLGCTHRYITVQLFVPLGRNCSIALRLSDTNHSRYRLILSTAVKSSNVDKLKPGNPLHFQVPLSIRRNCWSRVVLDVAQLTQETFGEINDAMFRTVDGIAISANCRVRNIFSSLEDPLTNGSIVPQQLEIVASRKINDIFVDGTAATVRGDAAANTPKQPRQPRPSPVPTLPTPLGSMTPSLPTSSKITFAFGTRASSSSSSFISPTANVKNAQGNTPASRPSSKRRTPGGSVPRRTRKTTPSSRLNKANSCKEDDSLLPDGFYTFDMHTQGGGPLSAPSPAAPIYMDRAASPFPEESFTPSSRYGTSEQDGQDGQDDEKENTVYLGELGEDVEPSATPLSEHDGVNGIYDRHEMVLQEEEEDGEESIPPCPTHVLNAMAPPPTPPVNYMDDNEDTSETDQEDNALYVEDGRNELAETTGTGATGTDTGATTIDDCTTAVGVEPEEEDDEAAAHIAFLYSQLELKRRQIQRMEADFDDVDTVLGGRGEKEERRNEENNTVHGMSDDDDNDGMVIMDDEDLQHVQKGEHNNDNDGDDEDDAEELVFDPVLQCFYSPRTNMYYESK